MYMISIYVVLLWLNKDFVMNLCRFNYRPLRSKHFLSQNIDTFTGTSIRESKMNAVARAQFQMLTLLQKYVIKGCPIDCHTTSSHGIYWWIDYALQRVKPKYHFVHMEHRWADVMTVELWLTHWGRDNMADIFQATFSFKKMYEFSL